MLSRKFNWSKIHLIYFALAACDMVAVLSGLGISEYTKSKFKDATHLAQYGDLVRDNTSALMTATIMLSKPANSVFQTKDAAKAREELKTYSDAFDMALSTDQLDGNTKALIVDDMRQVTNTAQPEISRHLGLSRYFPDAFGDIAILEMSMKSKKAAMVWESEHALDAYEAGDLVGAGKHMDLSNVLLRSLLDSQNAMFKQASRITDQVTQESQRQMAFSTSLQYAVGSFIVVLISCVFAYGVFVGKVLRGKYADLERANSESTAFNSKLQQVNDDVTRLNSALAQNIEDLKSAQDEIITKGKMAQLGQLTATVAHEIRNPLGAVRTSAYLLERKIRDKGLDVETQLERINSAVTRCDNIITQLLDFSRARAAQCQQIQLDDWLKTQVQEEATRLSSKIALTLELNAGDQQVFFDPDRMHRVVVNLVHNAAEAMLMTGKSEASRSDVAPHVIVRSQIIGGEAHIIVKDNGPGIPADLLRKVLDPLFTTKSFGTGLGLPAVENIMRQHGGRLVVQSEAGEGATFTAVWPVTGPAQQDAA